jgi:hypothetical protein
LELRLLLRKLRLVIEILLGAASFEPVRWPWLTTGLGDVPTFYPSLAEMKDFTAYVGYMEEHGAADVGLAKVRGTFLCFELISADCFPLLWQPRTSGMLSIESCPPPATPIEKR